jgi:hypothetical protein
MNRLSILILFLIFVNCEQPKELIPEEKVLGKWEIIQMGIWPEMYLVEDNDYCIFYPDSILIQYIYTSNGFLALSEKYWIDSLFNTQIVNNGIKYLTQYTYDFYENKLRLDITNDSINSQTIIYQRLK